MLINRNYFSESQNLECVGVGPVFINARYLLIQTSHYFQPTVQSPDEKLGSCIITPLMRGEVTGESPVCNFIENQFQVRDQAKETIELKNGVKWQGWFNHDGKIIYKMVKEEQEKLKINKDEKELLQNRLEGLQDGLEKMLVLNKESGNAHKEQVEESCKQIEQIQMKLLCNEPVNVQHNLDFYYTLAMELTFFLRKSYKGKKNAQNNQVLAKILEIFEDFIVYECDPKQVAQT